MSIPIFIMFLLSHFFNFGESRLFDIIDILVFILSIFFIQKYYRDNFYKGQASYSKLFGGTLLMICISGIILALVNYFTMKFVSPETISEGLELSKGELYSNNMLSDSEIELGVKYMEKIATPFVFALGTLLGYVFTGIIINLITSAINQRKGDGFYDAMNEISE